MRPKYILSVEGDQGALEICDPKLGDAIGQVYKERKEVYEKINK